jgi:diguanylate cyclase (GGDEF)-like protein
MNLPAQHDNEVGRTSTMPSRVLVVDDEVVIRALLTEILAEEGHETATAEDGKQAICLLERHRFDLIITDIVMPGVNGIEVLLAAKRIDPEYPVIMITGYPSAKTAVRLVNLGAADYITKPFNVDLIKVTVAKILAMNKMRGVAYDGESAQQAVAVDVATGTYNFALFNQLLENEVGRSQRQGHVCSLLMADIDGADRRPREGGALPGKRLLKLVGFLSQERRPGDVIGRTDHSELGLMLPETELKEARALGERVRAAAEAHFTISAGLSCFPRDASDPKDLLKTAHAALLAAKKSGGDALFFRQ